VFRARRRPQGEELVIRIGEDPTAADRHETTVAVFREDHTQHPFCSNLANVLHDAPRPSFTLLELHLSPFTQPHEGQDHNVLPIKIGRIPGSETAWSGGRVSNSRSPGPKPEAKAYGIQLDLGARCAIRRKSFNSSDEAHGQP